MHDITLHVLSRLHTRLPMQIYVLRITGIDPMHLHDWSTRPRNEKVCGQIYIIEKLSKFNVSHIDEAFFLLYIPVWFTLHAWYNNIII